jgi:hypothetical protein
MQQTDELRPVRHKAVISPEMNGLSLTRVEACSYDLEGHRQVFIYVESQDGRSALVSVIIESDPTPMPKQWVKL